MFDDFPAMNCTKLYESFDNDRELVGLWLHGFLSGANWADPKNSPEKGPDLEIVEQGVSEICAEDEGAAITGEILNSMLSHQSK
ncbi:hypothetical protein ACEWPL_000035 [Roseovarius sp. S1116L3]|uniref:hypothetical protein n=1 Tax=Roseovarius roseus TaxID=3342636 RepID=UPI0037290A77